MRVRIYKPARNAMQSGTARTKNWVLDFPAADSREIDPLMGWTSSDEDGFALRADLPEAWAGLTDEALEAASGVKGAKFCHNGRFIAVAESRDAILRMAELAVQAAETRPAG